MIEDYLHDHSDRYSAATLEAKKRWLGYFFARFEDVSKLGPEDLTKYRQELTWNPAHEGISILRTRSIKRSIPCAVSIDGRSPMDVFPKTSPPISKDAGGSPGPRRLCLLKRFVSSWRSPTSPPRWGFETAPS